MNAATASEIMMSSTFSGPFLEENEVSGQVVKSIYAEDQVYDGQTQRTGQAMVFCAAVKTELEMASASTEINPSTSDTISSCHTEVPLQYHTHLSLPIQQYSSIYTVEQEIYNEYELLPDESDNNLNISTIHTNTIEETNTDFYPNSSEIYEPSIYYNKFLYYHRLQSLSSPQTVGSFLTYLQDEYPMFYSQQYIRISIKYSRIDYYIPEAHIYLLHEHLLPNHFFVPFEDFSLFNNVPLKSSYPMPRAISTSINSNLEQVQDQISPLNLSICTHNIQGYNNNLKRLMWEHYCLSHDIQISCITETKISSNNSSTYFIKFSQFSYFWASTDSSKAGTAIMISNILKPHIHNILTYPGYAVAIDLSLNMTLNLELYQFTYLQMIYNLVWIYKIILFNG